MQNDEKGARLVEALPTLARELERLLRQSGESQLADQIDRLRIIDRCRCEDDFCASFYTQPKPEAPYPRNHRCIDLDAAEGMLILDVVADKIVHVEVLNRYDIRQVLLATYP
jgi:hypothetical protein